MAAGLSLLRIIPMAWIIFQATAVPKNIFRDKIGLCKRYGMACPMDKTCMIQQIEWPRTMRLPVCVAEKFVPAHMKACYQPPDAGPCGAEFIRWHFNVQANQCSWFYYSGCLGNRNNFFSKDACEKACLGDIISKREDSFSGDVKNLPESAEVIRAREFLSRPPPKFQELRSPEIETVIKRRNKSYNKSHKKRTSRRRNRNRTHRVVNSADVDRWPNAYRKTMRRGELFKLFSTLNYRRRDINNERAP
ncbi:uncharacterized protein LOC135461767 [Liolophura sinensis]|uniref:uncharacterized protein LOC135461767 n=1 Tax=Liolophura sinensis TaxID=3198878 RepID=UPI0031599282